MAPPPAINLDPSNFSKMHHTTSRSSEEEEGERESPDGGAIDEQHHHHSSAGARAPLTTGKRPRGRPPGSKNKPKTPTYVSVDPQDTLRPHILEVAPGADIASSLATYARTRGRGVSILYAVGSVAGITLRHHNSSSFSSSPVFLKGKQDIVALSGTVLPDNTPLGPATLTILVAGPHGQLIGGPVEGRLVAEGSVMVMATTFATATYEKLPLFQEAAVAPASSGLGGMDHQSGPPAVPDPVYHPRPHPYPHTHTHPGLNMNVNMNMGIATQPSPPPPPETNSSYANWFLQQQVHSNHGRPPLYINNN